MASTVFPAASGGVNRYTQVFTSTGTFTAPSVCNSVELFMVGGGGGGGGCSASNQNCGGAGGGGGIFNRSVSVTPGTAYTVTIGAGGAGGAAGASNGTNGSDTTFGSLATAYGGGYGGGSGSLAGGVRATGGGYGSPSGGGGSTGGMGGGAFLGVAWGGSGTQTASTLQGGRGGANNPGSSQDMGQGYMGFGGPGGMPFLAGSNNGGGARTENATGGSGTANTGGGGTAGANNNATAYGGGSGGSGYCVVTYWA
jgi:hypothetical protein